MGPWSGLTIFDAFPRLSHDRLVFRHRVALIALACSPMLSAVCCGSPSRRAPIEPVYDERTGRLQLLKYDSDGNGTFDTWSYMDGARVLRIEIDRHEDGTIDRWEYYGANTQLEKIGYSREHDGREDAWSYFGPDGSIARIEVSTRRDGRVTRVEHYARDVILRADEDTDQDGMPDKWETFENGRLMSVAFDTRHRGIADCRLVYGSNGAARVEVAPNGDGRFVPISAVTAPRAPRPE